MCHLCDRERERERQKGTATKSNAKRLQSNVCLCSLDVRQVLLGAVLSRDLQKGEDFSEGVLQAEMLHSPFTQGL